jgi:hypothetical protein
MSDLELERLRRFARWLDAGIPVPRTSLRIGLDPVIGLIPGAGDTVGALLGGWILIQAGRRGVPKATLLRMAFNVALDAILGAVPVVGDLFDFVWKSNIRNVDLLEKAAVDPLTARRSDRLFTAGVVAGMLLFCGALAILGVMLGIRLIRMAGF